MKCSTTGSHRLKIDNAVLLLVREKKQRFVSALGHIQGLDVFRCMLHGDKLTHDCTDDMLVLLILRIQRKYNCEAIRMHPASPVQMTSLQYLCK